jgi:transposase
MFIRETKKVNRATGKEYISRQLVESFRTPSGPRQRILLTIGGDFELDKLEQKQLANRIEEIVSGAQQLISSPAHIEGLAQHFAKLLIQKSTNSLLPLNTPEEDVALQTPLQEEFHTVDINQISHQKVRSIGAEHIALSTYQKLGIDTLLGQLGFSGPQRLAAAANIIARAIRPKSERATCDWLRSGSGLDELLGTSFENIHTNTLYRISDKIYQHRDDIEGHLANIEKSLFSLEEKIILYDITNTYFEGACKGHSKAKRGKSKEKRSDCPLVSLGVVLDSEGFPKHSEIFEGNLSEAGTLEHMIMKLNKRFGGRQPIIVMDSGIATKANIAWLKSTKYRYIVMMKKKERPNRADCSEVVIRKEKNCLITATLKKDLGSGESQLWCYSEQREKKEECIRSSRQKAFENHLRYLKEGLTKKQRMKSYDSIQRSLGRLNERYPRIAQWYKVVVTPNEDMTQVLDIQWSINDLKIARSYGGTYTLTTNIQDLDAKKLWEIYVMLSEAESCYRCLKSETGLRPNWHRKENRIDGHIFISLLAYHLVVSIRHQLNQHGIADSWDQIRTRMQSHSILSTNLRTRDGKTINIRNTSDPEEYHKKIYQALDLPQKPLPFWKYTPRM